MNEKFNPTKTLQGMKSPVQEPELTREELEVVGMPKFKQGDEIITPEGLKISIEKVTTTYNVIVHLEDGTDVDTIYTESELIGLQDGKVIIDKVFRKGLPIELSPGSKVQMRDEDNNAVYVILANGSNGLLVEDIDTGKRGFIEDKNSVIAA